VVKRRQNLIVSDHAATHYGDLRFNVDHAAALLWGSFASCAPISSALLERGCPARRGRLETGQQDAILPHSEGLIIWALCYSRLRMSRFGERFRQC
jgi:hypothetical protein